MSFISDLQGMYSPATSSLVLKTSQLGTVGTLLQAMVGSPQLEFTGVAQAPSEDSGKITFTAAGLELVGVVPALLFPTEKTTTVSVTVYEAETDPVIVIRLSLSATWSFVDLVPGLSQTFLAELGLNSGSDEPSSFLLLSTGNILEPELEIELEKGINWVGGMDESKGILTPVKWLLGTGIKAIGSIELLPNSLPAVSIELALPDIQTDLVGPFEGMEVSLQAVIVFDPSSEGLVDGLSISASLQWADGEAVFTGVLPSALSNTLEFMSEGRLPLPTPNDLDRYFGGESITQHLPAQFTAVLNSIQVAEVSLGIDLDTKQLIYAQAVLATKEEASFALIPDMVEISQVEFAIDIEWEDGEMESTHFLEGIFSIGDVDLGASVDLVLTPRMNELTALIQLDEEDVLDLPTIAKKFGLPKGAPKMRVEDFDMRASISGIFLIQADLADFTIDQDFVLNALTFDLEYDGEEMNMEMLGEMEMEIAGVSASVAISNENGWAVSAQTEEEDLISVGGLFTKFEKIYGSVFPVPDFLKNLSVVNLDMFFNFKSKEFSFAGAIQSAVMGEEDEAVWQIPFGDDELAIGRLNFYVQKETGGVKMKFSGGATMFGSTLTVAAELDKKMQISASATNVNLTGIIDALLGDIDFPPEVPDVVFDTVEMTVTPSTKEVVFSASATEDWEVPLGVAGFLIEDLQLSLERKAIAGGKFKTTGTLSGEASIGAVSFDLVYDFPGDFVFTTQIPEISLSPVVQDLCGTEAMMGISVPSSVANVALKKMKLRVAPQQKTMSFSGTSLLGSTELIVTKNLQGKWVFIAAFAPPASWKFSKLESSLKPLDKLSLENTALVLSSAPDKDVPLTVIQIPDDISINKGLTFFAALDMSDLGVKDLMNVSSLTVSTSIDRNPANIKLAAAMGGSFKISDNVAMGDMKFFLRPVPSNFELGISGSVLAKIDKSELAFVGTMFIRPIDRSAGFAATMLGFWDEPFGVKGLSVGNVALEVGIGIVPPPAVAAPIVGIAGSIAINELSGSAAVKADTANPGNSMIAASFNRLYLNDVIQTFCEKKVYNQIPADIRNTVLDAGLEDVAVYVVPQPTTIGELFYEQGFRFEGKLSIGEFDASFFFLLSYSEGFAIKASMDPIKIGSVFELAGAGNLPGPTLEVDLRVGGSPGIVIAGLVNIMGIQAQTLVSISDKGFLFFVEGKIFDLFVASLTVSGGNLKEGGDFYIKAQMKNDLISYLRENAQKAIQDAASEATKDIEAAQKDVAKVQKEVDKIDTDIKNMREVIKAERARDAKRVKDAENAVTAAQNKVNGLQKEIDKMRKTIQSERNRDAKRVKDAEKAVASAQSKVNKLQGEIDKMRKTIRAERARDTKRLSDARKKVSEAQNSVNSIQSEINSSHRRISTLNSHIKSKKKWYDKSPWYKKSYRWAEYAAYAAAKGAEITALYTKIGGMEAAKGTAYGVLEAAKQIVRGIELAAKTFPIDADVRIAGLFTAKETANGALEVAKQSLRGIKATIDVFPIDADVRIAGLFTAKGTASGTLEVAKQTLKALKATIDAFPIDADVRIAGLFTAKGTATVALQTAIGVLEAAKATVGGLASVADFVVEFGLGGLIDIKEAHFEGQLNVMNGGQVNMGFKILLLKKPLDLDLAFNFKNMASTLKSFTGKLIAEIN
ncbi:hypothetical protein R9C00_07125 [Flammeovirgaceae bacterium SG7u.111]|nr:hypothetical protein [Flammeovirgaceae bacterium SG7u.132]WPO37216.1 hypothetical protein R9C00_07125 [Flammeovirgaceae bacterium SG7u.111]